MTVCRERSGQSRTYNVKVARQRAMMGMLVFTVLTNSIDTEGDLPEEMTANIKIKLDVEGRAPLIIEDVFSGSNVAANRAPQALFQQVPQLHQSCSCTTPFEPVRLKRVECTAEIKSGPAHRRHRGGGAGVGRLCSGRNRQGDGVPRPYKGLRQRVPLTLKLPADLPEGSYTATVSDDLASARQELRDNPNLSNPPDLDHLFKALNIQTAAKRTNLVLRVPTQAVGVAMQRQVAAEPAAEHGADH